MGAVTSAIGGLVSDLGLNAGTSTTLTTMFQQAAMGAAVAAGVKALSHPDVIAQLDPLGLTKNLAVNTATTAATASSTAATATTAAIAQMKTTDYLALTGEALTKASTMVAAGQLKLVA